MTIWRNAASLLIWLTLASPALAQIQELVQARVAVRIDGKVSVEDATLPYHWDRRNEGRSGTADLEITFPMAIERNELYGLYFRRLGNAYEIWFNGSLVQRNGDLTAGDSSDYAKAPRYVVLPHHLFGETNILQIRIRADGGRRGGVARPLIGPEAQVRELFQEEQRWRVNGSFAVVVLSLVIGLVAIVLWLTQVDATQKRGSARDNLYLSAGIAEFAWALRVGDALIEQPPIPWTWWGTLQTAALAVWLASMAVFCMMLAGWDLGARGRWLRRALLGLVLTGCAAAFASFQFDRTWVLTAWFAAAGAFFASFGLSFIVSAWRSGNRMHHLVAIALAANVGVGLRDTLVFRLAESFGDNTLLRYSSVLFGLVLGYVLVTRFGTATAQARDLMRNLEHKVIEKEMELSHSYAHLERLAREQERTAERGRILRDMHDGVGSHITTAIRQLQSEKVTRAQVLETLRHSLDQLKLSIDAINLPSGDITALLANLRYRLEPRFAASDIELKWAVEVMRSLPGLDQSAMRHLQFIVFEALSNVLQHAQATVLSIEAGERGSGVIVRLVDNGRGFDASGPARKGLLSMRERASAIGAQLSISSSAAGTAIQIDFA